MGAFGSVWDMPENLRGRDVRFSFESPLQEANDRAKSQAFIESLNLLKAAAELDPTVRADFNLDKAFRDAASGVAPATWIVDEKQANAQKAKDRQAQMMQQAAQSASMGADIAQKAGDAAQSLQTAGLV